MADTFVVLALVLSTALSVVSFFVLRTAIASFFAILPLFKSIGPSSNPSKSGEGSLIAQPLEALEWSKWWLGASPFILKWGVVGLIFTAQILILLVNANPEEKLWSDWTRGDLLQVSWFALIPVMSVILFYVDSLQRSINFAKIESAVKARVSGSGDLTGYLNNLNICEASMEQVVKTELRWLKLLWLLPLALTLWFYFLLF